MTMEPQSQAVPEPAKSSSGHSGVFTSACQLMRRNPQLVKALLAGALQNAAIAAADSFLVTPFRTEFWGDRQAEIGGYVGLAQSVVAIALGGLFGRFGDAVDRRAACVVAGLLSFLPTWLLLMGMTEQCLWASTTARVASSFVLTCNVFFALVNDVTAVEDRELASGMFFASSCFLNVILQTIPSGLVFWFGMPAMPSMIYYCIVLHVLFLACIAWVRMPAHSLDDDQELPPPRAGGSCKPSCGAAAMVDPLRLMVFHPRIRRLAAVIFLMSIADGATFGIGSQYFYTSLGYTPGTWNQRTTVNVLSSVSGQIMGIPAFILTGYLAKQTGSLATSRGLILLGALLMSAGLAMRWVRQLWFVVVLVTCSTYSQLARAPLYRLVVGFSPPGRTGTAVAAVGVAGEVGSMISGAISSAVIPALLRTSIENPLGFYYPVAACFMFLAVIPLLCEPRGGWGVGRLDDAPAAGPAPEKMVPDTTSELSKDDSELATTTVPSSEDLTADLPPSELFLDLEGQRSS